MKAHVLKNRGRVITAGTNLAQLKSIAERDVWKGHHMADHVRTTAAVTGYRWKKDGSSRRLWFSVVGYTEWFESEWTIS